jgi:hypothetical protein
MLNPDLIDPDFVPQHLPQRSSFRMRGEGETLSDELVCPGRSARRRDESGTEATGNHAVL